MQKKRFFLTLLVCLMGLVGFAQKTVTGTVKDAAGEPMIGVSVVVNGTSTGSVTDINGNFTIQNVANNASLKISYIGYQTQTVKVGNQSSFNIVLKEDANSLDERLWCSEEARPDRFGIVAEVFRHRECGSCRPYAGNAGKDSWTRHHTVGRTGWWCSDHEPAWYPFNQCRQHPTGRWKY